MRRSAIPLAAALLPLLALGALALAGGAGPAAGDRRTVPAPIDGLEIRTQRSFPPRYAVAITAGLPGGCAQPHSHAVARTGDTIVVTVQNSMPRGDVACTMIYGSYELDVPIGSDFRSGVTYTVRVNDRTVTFTAE